jgi:MFS family permease
MAILEQDSSEETLASRPSLPLLSRLRWTHILAISIFWFALNFHWSALGLIILPSQVLKIAGELHKGQVLAAVLVPGAFIAVVANPLFGLLSDRTGGWLARWGRRKPYILVGTLVNVLALLGMAFAWDVSTLMITYVLVQLANNAATAPFHALLPDLVPEEQRGLASGVMGVLNIAGSIAGVAVAALFVDASRSLAAYQHGLLLAYGVVIAVLLCFMAITLLAVDERRGLAGLEEREVRREEAKSHTWLTRSALYNTVGIALVVVIAWSAAVAWNRFGVMNVQISGEIQQGILMLLLSLAVLRLFGFHPRRNPDFAWVLVTRLAMMMGIYTIQTFLQYYMRDVMGVANPEQETTRFIIIAALASLPGALLAGWLSDRIGRKRVIYLSGGLLALLGLVIVVTHLFTRSLPLVFLAGALFGIGGGAYQSVDWALVADVLPSRKEFAKDMGVWNLSLSLPQVLAPVIGGPLIDTFVQRGAPMIGFQLLFMMAVVYCLFATIAVRFIRR